MNSDTPSTQSARNWTITTTESVGTERNSKRGDLDFDYDEYKKDVIDAFISAWKLHAPSIIEDVEFDEIVSPRYYNFENDRLFCFVTMNEGWKDAVRDFMSKNFAWLKKRIKEDWSSRDGFFSFMSNDINAWDEKLFSDEDGRYIGTMIRYMMLVENEDVYDEIISGTLEDVYACEYVYVIADRERQEARGSDTGDARGMAQSLA